MPYFVWPVPFVCDVKSYSSLYEEEVEVEEEEEEVVTMMVVD